jgi:hypothetical protein
VLGLQLVHGAHPLPTTVWLVRGGAVPSPPWSVSAADAPTSNVLPCAVEPAPLTTTAAWCRVPPGRGTAWHIVLVNHGEVDPGNASGSATSLPSSTLWQASAPSAFILHYRAPRVASVRVAYPDPAAPAVGGFLLAVVGADFGSRPPVVTVGGLDCPVVPDACNHTFLLCVAPPRRVGGLDVVVVSQEEQTSSPIPFPFDPARVTNVVPGTLDAVVPADTPRRLSVRGVNFGVPSSGAAPTGLHRVVVGGHDCVGAVWVSDGQVDCTLGSELVVGTHNVTLVVANTSAASVQVTAVCPPGTYGAPGERCLPCPVGASCRGRGLDPVALRGYFPLDRAQFTPCVPAAACVGGVNHSVVAVAAGEACSKNYDGLRCSFCRTGSYRLRSRCATCPNTAWLLFLGFSLALVCAVAAAVYLSKKRINMAGLSIGVVSRHGCVASWLARLQSARYRPSTLPAHARNAHAFPCPLVAHNGPCASSVTAVVVVHAPTPRPGLLASAVPVCQLWV